MGLDDSVSDFTTPNRSNLQDLSKQDRTAPTDISNFTATESIHGTADVGETTKSHNILPASLVSPHTQPSDPSLPGNLKTPKPRPKPRYTNNSASASSPSQTSLLYPAIPSPPLTTNDNDMRGTSRDPSSLTARSKSRPAEMSTGTSSPKTTSKPPAPTHATDDIIDISSDDNEKAKRKPIAQLSGLLR